jgi:hypothetical protein
MEMTPLPMAIHAVGDTLSSAKSRPLNEPRPRVWARLQ